MNKFAVFTTFLLAIFFNGHAQDNTTDFSVMFYNVENLFDLENDTLTNDDDFTPEGQLHWTYKRLNKKLLNTSKVVLTAAGWELPAIVGLCEVENRDVLQLLCNETPLKTAGYKIIHKQSPDHRGIDVALLYQPDKFDPISYDFYPLTNTKDQILDTREILYLCGTTNNLDTLHFFVNHWPSRYSGFLESQAKRNLAARMLLKKVEELRGKYRFPKIIIVGDFNDNPTDESIAEILNAQKTNQRPELGKLYNLSYNWLDNGRGTLKYQLLWSVFDQVIVSGSLLQGGSGLMAKPENAKILNFPFLFEKDEKYGGDKPFRTYYGFTYQGGFSDHLPILLKLENSD